MIELLQFYLLGKKRRKGSTLFQQFLQCAAGTELKVEIACIHAHLDRVMACFGTESESERMLQRLGRNS